ncbi:MAG: DUF2442 domain-containing protein [Methylococcaceae bacterium]|nr:DUF2442 domain-containing protein [Methylococcaceae bacterium]
MNPRVQQVIAHDDHTLALSFANGETKVFDLSPYLGYPVFEPLQNISFFKLARAVHGTVVWPRDIDFDPDTLFLESHTADTRHVA